MEDTTQPVVRKRRRPTSTVSPPVSVHAPKHSVRNAPRRVTVLLFGGLAVYFAVATVVLYGIIVAEPASLSQTQRILIETDAILHGAGLAVAAVAVAAVRGRRRITPRWPRLAAVSVLIAVLASADRLVGIAFPPRPPADPIFELHPTRGWTNRPNGYGRFRYFMVRFDEHGLRIDEDGAAPTRAGKYRILFIGDSVTMGFYHPARAAWSRRAVERLNRDLPEPRFVELNGSVCGYDTRQECDWLIHEGLALSPDLVVLQFCLNDISHQFDPTGGPDASRHDEFAWSGLPTSRSGIRRAVLALTLRARFGSDLLAAAAETEHFRVTKVLADNPSDRIEGAWATALSQLDRFADTCRRAGVPMVLVCFPIIDQMNAPDAPARPQKRLAAFAAEHDVPYLDLLPAYRAAVGTGREASGRLFKDPTHPTVEGHRIAGEALAAFLESRKLPAIAFESD